MQAFSPNKNEIGNYSTAFFLITGVIGIAAIVLFRLRIKEVIENCLEPSNFTIENLRLQPSLITQPICDLDEENRVRKVAGCIIGKAKVNIKMTLSDKPIEFKIGNFLHKDPGQEEWTRELSISVLGEDTFFLCYAIAVLDFIYKYNSYLKLFSSDFSSPHILRNPSIGVVKEVVFAKSETELHVILASRNSMQLMINWLKKMAEPNALYEFNKKRAPQIGVFFEKVGLFVNIAKKEDDEFVFITGIPKVELEDVYISEKASGEFIQNENGTITYFSDS